MKKIESYEDEQDLVDGNWEPDPDDPPEAFRLKAAIAAMRERPALEGPGRVDWDAVDIRSLSKDEARALLNQAASHLRVSEADLRRTKDVLREMYAAVQAAIRVGILDPGMESSFGLPQTPWDGEVRHWSWIGAARGWSAKEGAV